MSNKITELREERAGLIAKARSLVDKAEAEKRNLTDEESGKYDEIMADARALDKRAKRQEELDQLARSQAEEDAKNRELNPRGGWTRE